MKPAPANQQTAQFLVDDHLEVWVDAWLADCRARNLKPSTIKRFYREKIGLFLRFAGGQAIARMSQITAGVVRDYLNHLEDTGHNPGGRHAAYRALRACLRFWADEVEPDGWRDPFKRARPPKVDLEPLQPVGLETVEAMAAACDRETLTGARNRAILLALLDTGCRWHRTQLLHGARRTALPGRFFSRKATGVCARGSLQHPHLPQRPSPASSVSGSHLWRSQRPFPASSVSRSGTSSCGRQLFPGFDLTIRVCCYHRRHVSREDKYKKHLTAEIRPCTIYHSTTTYINLIRIRGRS